VKNAVAAPARGFTLIEMMIALTLFSMITVATIAAMRTLGNTSSTLTQVTNRVDELRVVSDFLRNQIGAAMPVLRAGGSDSVFEGAAGYGTYFVGTEDALTWVSPLVAGSQLGGAFIMRLQKQDDRLVLLIHPYVREVDAVAWSDMPSRVLLDNVEKFVVGYLPVYGVDWLSQWEGSQRNPAAVRLNIRAKNRFWPELIIATGGASLNLR